ncbi:MAG: hypothetical protein A2Z83_04310 [Omnitrophica bacterium GWA2_52_8]|nr:MAG: hypothetical protein A2Z83_04310 [Omnitrophica bacterium GWA2_52_8]
MNQRVAFQLRKRAFYLLLGGMLCLTMPTTAAQAQTKEIEIILDCSRSMLDSVEGGKKLDVAKASVISVLNQIPAGVAVGLRVFSSTPVTGNVNESCKDSLLLVPVQTAGRQALITKIMSIEAHGATPIGYSLQEAAKDFSPAEEVQKTIILVSDGAETCGMDPVAVVQELRSKGIIILIHAIGFDVDDQAAQQLKTLAETAGGTYYSAGSAIQLEEVVSKAAQATVSGFTGRAQPKDMNLAAPENGGAVVLASDPKLIQMINEGHLGKHVYVESGSEIVVHFRDKKVMELSKVAVPIFQTLEKNIRRFEILVSVESPTAGFTSAGTFETQNAAFIADPYQEFVLEPVKARYMKLKALSFWNEGRWGYLYAMKVFGKEASDDGPQPGGTAPAGRTESAGSGPGTYTAQKIEKLKPTGPTNLALADNGGKVVAGSKPEMDILVDGKDNKYVLCTQGNEVIIGFKDNQLAELTKVAVPILKTQADNLRTFEIQISRDSPAIGFVSVGTFETQNLAFLENPYQEFTFDPARGRYLKLIVKSGYGSGTWAQLYEIRVFGELLTE